MSGSRLCPKTAELARVAVSPLLKAKVLEHAQARDETEALVVREALREYFERRPEVTGRRFLSKGQLK